MISRQLFDRTAKRTFRQSKRQDLANLFFLIAYGEQLAKNCAQWQSEVANDEHSRSFFSAQQQHERFHERLFKRSAEYLNP